MKLSILIVNWNSKDLLRACLLSIRRTSSHLSPQLVVVDGGSFDGCAEMLAAEFQEVEFVQSPDNIGFGRSNNLGFERVTGEALLLLNPDTELNTGATDVLLSCLLSLPDAGLIGAKQLNADGSLQLASVHRLPTPLNCALDSNWIRRHWWSRNRSPIEAGPLEVEAISGACMMMHAETFRQMGGFDARFFMYAEDMDLCFRIRQTGLRIFHAHQAEILHHGGGSSRTQFRKFPVVMLRDALNLYFKINHSPAHAWIYRAMIGVSALLRVTVLCIGLFIGGSARRRQTVASTLKWWTILRWSLGIAKQPSNRNPNKSEINKVPLCLTVAERRLDLDS